MNSKEIVDGIGDRELYRTLTPISDSLYEVDPERVPSEHGYATLVSSKLPNGNHMPVIDLDLGPSMLVPSSTPGHYHLYLNVEMSFGQMLNMLQAMTDAGVVQPGFNRFSREREQSFVRYPGVTKANEHLPELEPAPAGIKQSIAGSLPSDADLAAAERAELIVERLADQF
jgi:hypothetical protein